MVKKIPSETVKSWRKNLPVSKKICIFAPELKKLHGQCLFAGAVHIMKKYEKISYSVLSIHVV